MKRLKPSELLGSWPAIFAVLTIPYFFQYVIKVEVNVITFQLSVLALTFTQLVLRQQNKETEEDKRVQEEQLETEKKIEQEVKQNGDRP